MAKVTFHRQRRHSIVFSHHADTFCRLFLWRRSGSVGNNFFLDALISKEREEDIVSDLDSIDVKQTLGWRNKGEVDGVRWHPHRPRSHDCRLEVALELLGVIIPRLSFRKVQVSKEHATKDGIPDGLIDKHLGGDSHGLGSRKLAIQESVEKVAGATVDKESERSHAGGTHNIKRVILFDKSLRQNISDGKSCQRGQAFGQKRLRLKQFVVTGPKSRHCCGFEE